MDNEKLPPAVQRISLPLIYNDEIGVIETSDGMSLFITDELTEKQSGNDLHVIGQWIVDKLNAMNAEVPALEVGSRWQDSKGIVAVVLSNRNGIVFDKYRERAHIGCGNINEAEFRERFPTRIEKGQSNG